MIPKNDEAKADFDKERAHITGELIQQKSLRAVESASTSLAQAMARYETTVWWNNEVAEIDEYAEENGWSEEHTKLVKYQTLTRAALRDPDDKWSGRGNDLQRTYNDERRNVLSRIETDLRYE